MIKVRRCLLASAAMLALAPWPISAFGAASRSYQECQALAVQRGVPVRYTHKVFQDYERFKAAGTALRPRGLIARCIAGTN